MPFGSILSPNGSNLAPSDPQKYSFRCRGVLISQNVAFLQPDLPQDAPGSTFDSILGSFWEPFNLNFETFLGIIFETFLGSTFDGFRGLRLTMKRGLGCPGEGGGGVNPSQGERVLRASSSN